MTAFPFSRVFPNSSLSRNQHLEPKFEVFGGLAFQTVIKSPGPRVSSDAISGNDTSLGVSQGAAAAFQLEGSVDQLCLP